MRALEEEDGMLTECEGALLRLADAGKALTIREAFGLPPVRHSDSKDPRDVWRKRFLLQLGESGYVAVSRGPTRFGGLKAPFLFEWIGKIEELDDRKVVAAHLWPGRYGHYAASRELQGAEEGVGEPSLALVNPGSSLEQDVALLAERMGQFLAVLEQFAESLGRIEGGSGAATPPSASEIAGAVAEAVAGVLPKKQEERLGDLIRAGIVETRTQMLALCSREDPLAARLSALEVDIRGALAAANNAVKQAQNLGGINSLHASLQRLEAVSERQVKEAERLGKEVRKMREEQRVRDETVDLALKSSEKLVRIYQAQFDLEKPSPNLALSVASLQNGVLK